MNGSRKCPHDGGYLRSNGKCTLCERREPVSHPKPKRRLPYSGSGDATWGLADEKRFLDGLGTWCINPGDRRKLLLSYLQTILLRRTLWARDAYQHCLDLLRREYPLSLPPRWRT